MTHIESSKLQERLKIAMEQELHLTRALLGNLHQEEQSLIVQDSNSWNQVMQERASMLDRLKNIRLERASTTTLIAKELHLVYPKFEESFPLNLESCCEILHLSDQLIALTERMNYQQNRNQHLMTGARSFSLLQPQAAPKAKVTVAVAERKEIE